MATNIDALYRRARKGRVTAPEWVMPYVLVRPSESRRQLEAAFREEALSLMEVNAVRGFIKALERSEAAESAYPTWNQFVDEEAVRLRDDRDVCSDEADTITEPSIWEGAFSRTINHNETNNERFMNFMTALHARYEEGQ